MLDIGVKEEYTVEVRGASFTGCPLNPAQVEDIERRVTTGRGRKKRVNQAEGGNLIFIETVTGWKGVALKGKEMPCTEENKRYLVENRGALASEILDALDDAKEEELRAEKKKTKNSGSSPD